MMARGFRRWDDLTADEKRAIAAPMAQHSIYLWRPLWQVFREGNSNLVDKHLGIFSPIALDLALAC